jgi:glycine oxidase
MNREILIIGGGFLGMLAARELAADGARVTIFDRHLLGRESSWAGGGILSPLYPWTYPDAVNRLAHWSQLHYPDLMRALLESTGVDPEWVRSGLLILGADDTESATKWAESYAHSLRIVDNSEIESIQPGLAVEGVGGIWMPDIAQVRNPRLLAALRRDLEQNGIELRENCPVEEILHKDGRFRGLRTRDGEFAGQQCLLTAGAWTGGMLQATGLRLEIGPVMGQMLLLQAHPQQLTRIVLRDRRYVIPRRDGRILVGSTMEDVGFDKHVTGSAAQDLRAAALRLMPALADAPVEMQWAGLRPSSPDGIPYMGGHPEIDGLYVCSGHFRNGFATGLASARLVVDLMGGREPILDPAPYDPAGRGTAP